MRGRLVVALESSGALGSVALAEDGQLLGRAFLPHANRQSAELLPAVDQALAQAGRERAELQGVLVGAGPGSFTGVRVAAAIAKGFAHALGIPVWALSSLAAAALAEEALPHGLVLPEDVVPPSPGTDPLLPPERPYLRYVLFDARDDRVYGACYEITSLALREVVPPRATRVGDVLAEGPPAGAVFVGDAALKHRQTIKGAGFSVLGPHAGIPTADGLVHLLRLQPGLPPLVDYAGWEPEYLKASSAERARMG